MTKSLIHATRRGLETKIAKVEARAGRGTGSGAGEAKPPKFDGTTPWTVFRHQFETAAEHDCWTYRKISTYLITDVLQRVLKGATYGETDTAGSLLIILRSGRKPTPFLIKRLRQWRKRWLQTSSDASE
jgi:hypothetical protein